MESRRNTIIEYCKLSDKKCVWEVLANEGKNGNDQWPIKGNDRLLDEIIQRQENSIKSIVKKQTISHNFL